LRSMPSQNESPSRIDIEFIGFTMKSVKELEAWIEKQPEVANIQFRVRTHDGLERRDAIFASLTYMKLLIEIGTAAGTLLAAAAYNALKERLTEKIKEWLKTKHAEDAEVTLLFGPDGKPLIKIKRKQMK
jgi:hypothetical protein